MEQWYVQWFMWMVAATALVSGGICFFVGIALASWSAKQPKHRWNLEWRQGPSKSKSNPPRGGSNVQPPREVRCAQYEALGGIPITRDGKVVGYTWEGVSPVGFQVESVSPGVSLTPLGTTITLEDPDTPIEVEADAPVWGGKNVGWHWEWDVEKMFGEYVRDAPRGSLEDA